ncbi:hypothetical protein JCM8547_000916 [Rhodosporidiobolus lusitaniae]
MDNSTFAALLPKNAPGYLPYWMLFVSSLAVFNGVQNFLTTKLTRQVYARSPANQAGRRAVNPLQARTFAVWTLMSAIVRLYAAYNISNKAVYDITLASYVLALGHFTSEFLLFGTAGLKGAASPFIVATTSLTWMIKHYDFYVKA